MPMTRERSDEGGGRGMVLWQWGGGHMCMCMRYGAARYACGVVGEGDEEWGVERTEVV